MSTRVVWAVDWPVLLVLWPVYVLKALIAFAVWAWVVPFKVLRWAFTGRGSRR